MRTIFFGGVALSLYGISQGRFDGLGLVGVILMFTASGVLIYKELNKRD